MLNNAGPTNELRIPPSDRFVGSLRFDEPDGAFAEHPFLGYRFLATLVIRETSER